VARETAAGDKRLVAYVVAQEGVEPSASGMREQLMTELAEYMVPSAFVIVPELPLTPNGKLDRKALPEPDIKQVVYEAPEGRTERRLASIWEGLLEEVEIGRHAHFFELGGHSLLAMRVASEVSRVIGKKMTVRAMFEYPVLRRLAAHIDELPEIGFAVIPSFDRSEPIPLSFAQQRLWFIDQMEGASAGYNIPIAFRLRGELDDAALRYALDALVARHEVLRTAYVDDGEGIRQRILAPMPVALRYVDLREEPQPLRERSMEALLQREAEAPFDLSSGPILRCVFVRMEEADAVLSLTTHHIASDGWSMSILFDELVEFYRAHSEGRAPSLPTLGVQYADYAVWQRTRMQDGALTRNLDYWRERLAGIPAVHSLPLDRPRPAYQRFDGAVLRQEIDAELRDGLHRLATRGDASLFMVLQAALAALLSRWSGETDIVIGSPIAGRLHKDIEPLIGFFVNTLVLRTDVSGDPDFDALLRRVRAGALEAYEHQEIPFELLVENLKPERSLSHAPIFQILFTLQNNAQTTASLPGVSLSPIVSDAAQSKFDLQLSVQEHAGGLLVHWTYATSLFDAITIQRMSECFRKLLAGIVSLPDSPIAAHALFDDRVARELIDLGTGPTTHKLRELTLPERIATQVTSTPDRVAIRGEHTVLTYADLEQRASRLARLMSSQGVGVGERIGIHIERSPLLSVALYAAMKSGAAYVPLDHRQPPERLARIVADAGIRFVLVEGDHSRLQADDSLIVIDVATAADAVDASISGSMTPFQVPIDGDDIVYVLYTSGSTGMPKGVEIRHAGLMDYCAFALEGYYAPSSLEGSLVATSPAFDLTVPSLYVPLIDGGCVEFMPPENELEALVVRLDGSDAPPSLLRMTPSHALALLELADPQPRLQSHAFVIGGEAFPPALAHRLCAKYPNALIYNHYGPTEAVVGCSWYDVTARLDVLDARIPVGRPMANTRLYVMDASGRLQPPGVPGELWIAGAGVARRYLNRPELTEEKFVNEPFRDGERAYRSGDLVRWRNDGQLEFLGRVDDQVKIRGFRVELGDIVAALRACDGVRDVAVVLTGEGVDARLVGYLVGDDDALVANVRDYAIRTLPSYMQPASYAVLEKLPLSPNGKIDRRALPNPSPIATECVPPATETEAALVEILRDLLGIEEVGVTADFFELGGHSLLATRAINAIRRRFEIDLSVRVVFERSDIRGIAAAIDDQIVKRQNLAKAMESTAQFETEW
jgi:amino acid adenylation domain-containing protein